DMPGGGHEGHDMPGGCSMKMTFNWDLAGMCVVFEWWHVTTSFQMILSCLACMGISILYEALRLSARRYDQKLASELRRRERAILGSQEEEEEEGGDGGLIRDGEGPYLPRPASLSPSLSREQQTMRSIVYAMQVALGFWIMLVFMTYNAYLMGSVVVGAGIGHYLFARDISSAAS
ncbi:Ctr copper transporter, partial [Piptocephalis cylindrospora]